LCDHSEKRKTNFLLAPTKNNRFRKIIVHLLCRYPDILMQAEKETTLSRKIHEREVLWALHKQWYCSKCDSTHDKNVRRFDFSGRVNGEPAIDSSCTDEGMLIGEHVGCAVCGKKTVDTFTLGVELINQNALSLVLHCSDACLRVSKKKHFTEPWAEGYILCGGCDKRFKKKLKKCSKCKNKHYCSVECQRKDWPKHKLVCKNV
jgi:hypothetical protein